MHHLLSPVRFVVAVAALLSLGACASEAPVGPSLPVMPGDGKTLSQFNQDDIVCRQFAGQRIGASPGAAANQSGVATAAVGTVVGAAAGALIGTAAGNPAAGAAIGGGAGLLTGSAVGIGNANEAAGDV
jgi:OmpA family protein